MDNMDGMNDDKEGGTTTTKTKKDKKFFSASVDRVHTKQDTGKTTTVIINPETTTSRGSTGTGTAPQTQTRMLIDLNRAGK